jgi:dihydroxyacetone kinase phosphoprotein-dependent L subunit
MKSLNALQTREMLRFAAHSIIDSKPMLTEIDGKIGDGDHGIGMELGMNKALDALEKLPEGFTAGDAFKTVGRAMMMSMGGASGVIFGTLFQSGAKAVSGCSELDGKGLASIFRVSLDAIKARGGAQPGDKTMVDALEPAVEAMEGCGSEELADLFAAAEEAARQGMEATKNYEAKFGRAKSLMQRSIGYQDAGATSVWIIFKAMHEYVSRQ